MRILLTAGGTREPIDDVRVLANTSSGRLGARLADAAHAAGHRVLLLHGQTAARPVEDVERRVFTTAADLWELLERELPRAEVVLHAAAVSDYLPLRSAGKLSSSADELLLRLVRAPKLIDRMRDLAPRAVLVGFKLTSGQGADQRVERARALLARARLDLVLANDTAHIAEHDHQALLVGPDQVRAVRGDKRVLARALISEVERLATCAGQGVGGP